MPRRRVSPLVAALVLVALAAAGAGAVRAAEPELGATVQSRLYVAESRALHVYNRSTIPATFTPQASAGWAFDPTSLTLDPDTEGTFTLTGTGDDAAATIVSVTAAESVAAMDASVLQFPATIHLERPFDPGVLLIFMLLIFAVLVALFTVYRLRRVRGERRRGVKEILGYISPDTGETAWVRSKRCTPNAPTADLRPPWTWEPER